MKYGSVCSGIEAATVAWHPLGWKPAFFSEIEKFPRAVLAHHFPEVPCHGDFTTIQAGEYDPIDLLVGGTPCQDFSVAGLRAGLGGDRGRLTIEFLELARRLRPKWLVWENVPGVLSADDGRAFGLFLGLLGELGYGFAYRVLDAQHFGVPQRRRRVFVVGHLGDWRRAAAVLFERDCMSWNPPPCAGGGPRTATDVEVGADFGEVIAFGSKERAQDAGSISPPLRAMGSNKEHPNGGGQIAIAFAMRGREGGSMPEVSGEAVSALRAASGGSTRDMIAISGEAIPILDGAKGRGTRNDSRDGSAMGRPGDPMFTLRNSCAHAVSTHSTVRRLTPRECERLQGFPDDFTLIAHRKKPPADGARYKALGNSMAVPVMAWLGERIAMVEAIS